ncbi:uncharacterized protein EI97DRAFT_460804 [Westerdykella ornata]|uniref:Uncharacterized protein n=1 Tax=Westerdykella ornata TaxID=318751 RepID=A0A6A6JC69_WESOR|nr:uncharacterized protein EI97DRAFT_460804 [Westerdykella ornata]KAF2273875.1 hypothetical protein EI97DRAFT_460804 [Westerdykella ornata]
MTSTFSSGVAKGHAEVASRSQSPSPLRTCSALRRSTIVLTGRKRRKRHQDAVVREAGNLERNIECHGLPFRNIETYRAYTPEQPHLRRYNVPAEGDEVAGWGFSAAKDLWSKSINRTSSRTQERVRIPTPNGNPPICHPQPDTTTAWCSIARHASSTGSSVNAASDYRPTPTETSYASACSSLDEKPSSLDARTDSRTACDAPVIVSPLPTRPLAPKALAWDDFTTSSPWNAEECSIFSCDSPDLLSLSEDEGECGSTGNPFPPLQMMKAPRRADRSAGEICPNLTEEIMSLMSCWPSRKPSTASGTPYRDDGIPSTSSMPSCDGGILMEPSGTTSAAHSVSLGYCHNGVSSNVSSQSVWACERMTPAPPSHGINASPRDLQRSPSSTTLHHPETPATTCPTPITIAEADQTQEPLNDIPDEGSSPVLHTHPTIMQLFPVRETPAESHSLNGNDFHQTTPESIDLDRRDSMEPTLEAPSIASSNWKATAAPQPSLPRASSSSGRSGSSKSVSIRRALVEIYSVDSTGDRGEKLQRAYAMLDCASGGADGPMQFERTAMALEGSRCALNVMKKHAQEKRKEKEEKSRTGIVGSFKAMLRKRRRGRVAKSTS